MGGSGSGRGVRWTKAYCESFLNLDIRKIARAGRLKPDELFSWTWSRRGKETANIMIRVKDKHEVELSYRMRSGSEEWKQVDDYIEVSWSSCNYGGQRAWWICPGCGRRVAVLYGGKYFRCRKCHSLAYACQSETYHDRLLRKTHKAKRLLGEYYQRPKGMHRKTYERLENRIMTMEEVLNLSFLATVEKRWPEMISRIRGTAVDFC